MKRAVGALAILTLLAAFVWDSGRVAAPADVSPEVPGREVQPEPVATKEGTTPTASVSAVEPGTAPNSEPCVATKRVEGVLLEFQGVTQVCREELPPPRSLPFPATGVSREWLGNLSIVADPCLKAFPRGRGHSFVEFLQGGDDVEPAAFVHLALEVTEQPANDDEKVSRPPPENAAPRKVVRVVEAEEFGSAWLRAWTELYRSACVVETRLAEPPGVGKRARIVPVIADLKSALDRARHCRSGDPIVRWRVRAETACVEPVAEDLLKIGLADELGWKPLAGELRDIFDRAADPVALRTTIVALWGDAALDREIDIHALTGHGSFIADGPTALSTLTALSQESFDRLRSLIDAMGLIESEHRHERVCPPGIPDWIGLTVEDADERVRSLFLQKGAAVVCNLVPDSVASQAGFGLRDVIWRVVISGRCAGETEDFTGPPQAVEGERSLDWALWRIERVRGTARFDVLRDGLPMVIDLPLPGLSEEALLREREANETLNKPPLEKTEMPR